MVRDGNAQPSKAQQLADVLSYLVSEVASLRAAAEANTNLSSLVAAGGVTPVVSPTGLREVDVSGLPGAYVGQLVRIRDGRAEVPSFTDIGTLGGASGIVVQVLNGGRTAVVARSAAMAPMRVSSPVVGSEVLLYNSGTGTCSVSDLTSVSPSAETQVVGICDSSSLDANGCVRVLNVEFGGGYVEAATPSDVYWRTDGGSSPSTGLWELGDSVTSTADFTIDAGSDKSNWNVARIVFSSGGLTGSYTYDRVTFSGGGSTRQLLPPDPAIAPTGSYRLAVLEAPQTFTAKQTFTANIAVGDVTVTSNTYSTARTQFLTDGDGPIPQLGLSLATASGANLP